MTSGEVRGLVFLGPTMPAAAVHRIDPSLLILPPAGMGDLVSAVRHHRPTAVALIDGTFRQNLSVFHKEILWAMAEGVWVIGASSMGALRAAELHPLGMIGVGAIFEGYASGALTDDDEVALVHAGAEFGHRAVSDPMVNIRATLERALELELLTRHQADELAAAQKARHFPKRRLELTLDDLALLEDPLDAAAERALRELIAAGGVDQKRADAEAAIRVLSDHMGGPIPESDRPDHPVAATFQGTLERDVTIGWDDDLPVTFDAIRRHSALNDGAHADSWRTATMTSALLRLAEILQLDPSDDDHHVATDGVRQRLELDGSADDDRLRTLDMTAADLDRMIHTEAVVVRFERWVASTSGYTRSTQAFIDQTRLEGRYLDLRTEAGVFEDAAARNHSDVGQPSLERLIDLHAALSGWTLPADLDRWIEANQMGSRAELYDRLLTSLLARAQLTGLPIPLVGQGSTEDVAPIATRGHQG